MGNITVADAARMTRTSKSTIQRAINKHELSATRDDNDRWMIDPSELSRVFEVHHDELLVQHGAPENTESSPSHGAPEPNHQVHQLHHDKEMLEVQFEASQQLVNQYKDQVDDLKRRLDEAEGERRKATAQITALLTHQTESQPRQSASRWRGLLGMR